jgi:hypothetical protein
VQRRAPSAAPLLPTHVNAATSILTLSAISPLLPHVRVFGRLHVCDRLARPCPPSRALHSQSPSFKEDDACIRDKATCQRRCPTAFTNLPEPGSTGTLAELHTHALARWAPAAARPLLQGRCRVLLAWRSCRLWRCCMLSRWWICLACLAAVG